MADSILRLKVESQEYDNKLKRAAEGIQRLAAKIHDSQGEFVGLTNDQKEFIKNLQYMNTVSQTATGKVKELEAAYKGLQTMYNGFNAFEKNSEEGKILAEQLSILKEKTLQARAEMEDANKSLSSTGGFLDQLTSKFTVNIDALKLFDIGMKAAKGALDVAKDAFFNNEQQLDEWGRVVESSESLYKGFLNALNTGDISGYLSNISNIVQAARDAYDALDELNTYNAFNQINVEKTRTNMTESIVDFREGIGSKDAVREAGEAYKKELRDRQKKEEEAFKKRIGELAATRGVDAEGLESVLRGTYDDYKKKKGVQPTGERQTVIGAGAFARLGTENFAQNKLEKMAEALRNLNDTELQSVQSLGAQAERTGNEIAQVDRQLIRVLNGRQGPSGGRRSGGGTGGKATQEITYAADSIVAQQKLVAELTKQWNEAGAEVRNQYVGPLVEAEAKLKSMQNEMGLQKENAAGKLLGGNVQTKGLGSIYGSEMQEMKIGLTGDALKGLADAIAKDQKRNEKKEISLEKEIGSISSGVSNIFGGIEQMGLEVPEEIKQGLGVLNGIMSILSGISTILIAIEAINTADTIIPFARGGIVRAANGFVPGSHYSGDMIPALLNSGELVLNRAQQNSLANQLQGTGLQNLNLKGVVSGEQIMIVLDRHLQRSGRGELAVWK